MSASVYAPSWGRAFFVEYHEIAVFIVGSSLPTAAEFQFRLAVIAVQIIAFCFQHDDVAFRCAEQEVRVMIDEAISLYIIDFSISLLYSYKLSLTIHMLFFQYLRNLKNQSRQRLHNGLNIFYILENHLLPH